MNLPAEILRRCGIGIAPRRATRVMLGGFRSKLERDYRDHLRLLQLGGAVTAWAYEPETFVCAGGTRYTPDFIVWWANPNRVEVIEVKGHWWAKDRVRMREAAPVIGWPLIVVRRVHGQWVYDAPVGEKGNP